LFTLALPPASLAGDVINSIKLRGELRWVLFTLILAEENGITRDNVAVKWPELKQRRLESRKIAGGSQTN